MSGGFRGVSQGQDVRFGNKQNRLMKDVKFPKELDLKVDYNRVYWPVINEWVATRITELLGIEEEVLIGMVLNLLEDHKAIKPKELHVTLTPFLEKNTSLFMKELWLMLVSANTTVSGVPQQILDAKELELKAKRETEAAIQAALERRRREEAERVAAEMERVRLVREAEQAALPPPPPMAAPSDRGGGNGDRRRNRWDRDDLAPGPAHQSGGSERDGGRDSGRDGGRSRRWDLDQPAVGRRDERRDERARSPHARDEPRRSSRSRSPSRRKAARQHSRSRSPDAGRQRVRQQQPRRSSVSHSPERKLRGGGSPADSEEERRAARKAAKRDKKSKHKKEKTERHSRRKDGGGSDGGGGGTGGAAAAAAAAAGAAVEGGGDGTPAAAADGGNRASPEPSDSSSDGEGGDLLEILRQKALLSAASLPKPVVE